MVFAIIAACLALIMFIMSTIGIFVGRYYIVVHGNRVGYYSDFTVSFCESAAAVTM